MNRNGLPVVLTIALLLLTGCTSSPSPVTKSEISTALEAVQQMYGPPSSGRMLPQEYMGEPLRLDLNGDGREEMIVAFGDEGLGKPAFTSANTKERPLITRGFLVLTEIDGRQWPLFYFFNEYRTEIHITGADESRGIVASGSKDGEYFWGWRPGNDDWPPAWEARHRPWDYAKSEYGPWGIFPPLFAIYGK